MLNYIWSFIIICSIICSVVLGNTHSLSESVINSTASATELLMTIAGTMCLWSGLMKIAEKSGLTAIFARLFSPLLGRLFPRLDKNSAAFESISMNISANLLGLGNTATPFGLKAMEELHRLDGKGDEATDEMVIFVVMNTASLQLIPTMLASLRSNYGSAAPFEIIVPVWLSSACALMVALILACGGNTLKKRKRR